MLRLLSLAGLVACLQIGSPFAGPRHLPAAVDGLHRMVVEALSGVLFFNLGVTMLRVAAAFTIAMAIGAAIGFAMGRDRIVDRLGDPWLLLMLNLPALVIIV